MPSTVRRPSRLLLLSALFAACAAEADDEPAAPPVVEITARDYAFEGPDTVESGWRTVRLANTGSEEHFVYLYRLPDGKTFDAFVEEFLVPFGTVWNQYAAGELDRAEAEAKFGEEIPSWFFTDVVSAGGVALTEPGETAASTIHLAPGTYVMECYVKTPSGRWHTELGMQRTLVVTGSETVESPTVEADAVLELSNYEISAPDSLAPGRHVIEVRVRERPEGFMGHDANLFRLDGASAADIVEWMDWMELDQFRAPAPAISLGGMEHLAPGATGYVHVDLSPGDYAWISEGYGARGVTKAFVVR